MRRLEPPSEKKAARIDGAETLSPPELFQKYVEEDHLDADDPKREGMSWDELKQKAVETGQKILVSLYLTLPLSSMGRVLQLALQFAVFHSCQKPKHCLLLPLFSEGMLACMFRRA